MGVAERLKVEQASVSRLLSKAGKTGKEEERGSAQTVVGECMSCAYCLRSPHRPFPHALSHPSVVAALAQSRSEWLSFPLTMRVRVCGTQ